VAAAVAPEAAAAVLAAWRAAPGGSEAQCIGVVEAGDAHVVLVTELGGERTLEELEDDPLPRIC
jgi:hydrogenase expression/formation protein HypE